MLPKNWTEVDLGQVVERMTNGSSLKQVDAKTYGLLPITRIETIAFEEIDLDRVKYVKASKDDRKKYGLEYGDILFSHINSDKHLGKTAIHKRTEEIIHGINLLLIRTNELCDCFYLNYYFKYYRAKGKFLEIAQRSVNQSSINQKKLRQVKILLPSLPEQKRIVAKLDTLFTHLDQLKARLEKIPTLIKQFRQAVLTQAVTGKLTEEWRKDKNSKVEDSKALLLRIQLSRSDDYSKNFQLYKKGRSKKPKSVTDPNFTPVMIHNNEYPKSWQVTRIRDVSDCLDFIRKPINKDERSTRQGDIPYYGANGQVGWIDDYLFDEDLVIVVEDETFIGREISFSYIIRGKSWVNNHAHVLRPVGGISVEYLHFSLAYYNFIPLTAGTTGRRKLTQGALLDATLPIAPLKEQKEIVHRVESLFALADRIEASYQSLQEKIDHLPQAILSKAFWGELVGNEVKEYTQETDTLPMAAEP